jgi:hypothetical protein
VLGQAVGLAFLAALSSPTALLVAAVYLGSASPRKTSLFYLAGAVLMSAVIGVIVILALRAGGLNLPHDRTPRYGLRLGLGVAALAIGVVIARRKPKPPRGDRKPGLMSRLIARPSPVTAFTTGLLIFTPSVAFIAALQVIATAQTSDALIAGGLALVVAIDVLGVWVPYLLYLIAPEPTTRRLKAIDNWLRAHGRALLLGGLAAAGVFLILNGVLGLTGTI